MEATKRLAIGLSMLMAPLLLLVGFVIHPPEPKNGAEMLEVIANNTERWNAAHILFSASMVLSIPAVLGLMLLLRQRGAWFGFIGGSLALIGVVFFGVFIGVELAMSAIASKASTGEHAGLESAMQTLIDFQGPLPIVFLGINLNLGFFVLAIGLFATRVVPRWTSIVIEGASLVLIGGLFSNPVGAVGAVVLLVGLGAVGLQTLKSAR